jgi:hypothetical protein
MDELLHNVSDLPSTQRSVIESIIGHALRDDQQLFIAAIDAAVEPAAAVRQKAWDELQEIITEAHENVLGSGVTPEALDQTIDEACNEVRYGE